MTRRLPWLEQGAWDLVHKALTEAREKLGGAIGWLK